jgi:ATP-dependent Lon protease
LAFNRPVKGNIAMTGEISLTGKVIGIGGLKEKTMAAKRSNITELILPERNRKDFDELPDQLKQGVTPNFVEHYSEVFKLVFPAVETPVAISPPL